MAGVLNVRGMMRAFVSCNDSLGRRLYWAAHAAGRNSLPSELLCIWNVQKVLLALGEPILRFPLQFVNLFAR